MSPRLDKNTTIPEIQLSENIEPCLDMPYSHQMKNQHFHQLINCKATRDCLFLPDEFKNALESRVRSKHWFCKDLTAK